MGCFRYGVLRKVVLCVLVLGPEVMQENVGGGQWEGPRARICWSCLMEREMFGVAELIESDGT